MLDLPLVRSKKALRHKMLVAVERLPKGKYRCVCDCGNERIVNVGHFNSGTVKSCGCTRFRRDVGAKGPCVVKGCANRRCNSKGWCWMHYTRWRRHGDPLQTFFGHAQKWLDDHKKHKGDDCLTWPFGCRENGYGQIVYDGEHTSPHRKMCELVHGPAPTPEHEAAHLCGHGHKGCVNPQHLRWKTHAENEADKLLHGTHNRGERHPLAKLTEQQVREIRATYRKGQENRLAERFGCAPNTVKSIARGKAWAWLNE